MKNNLLNYYWHPFLIGLFPVLFLFAHNIAYVPVADVFLPFFAVLLFSPLVFGFSKLLLKGNLKAAIFTSSVLISFFTYGAVYAFLQDLPFGFIRKHSFLLSVNLALLLLIGRFLFRLKTRPVKLNQSLNVFSIILLALPLTQLLFDLLKGNLTSNIKTSNLESTEWQTTISPDERPDILYLILDGYGRKDILQKYYKLDNQPFLDSLQQEGFQVAEKSTSNYCRTVASVASSLNLDYIQNLDNKLPGFCFADLEKLIEDASLLKFLVKQKYYLYGFASGYGHTELTRHVNLLKPYETLPPFHYMVLNKTPFILIDQNAFLLDKYKKARKLFTKDPDAHFVKPDTHRDMILYSLNHLQDFIGRPEPSFVFADIFVGHPPFIFRQDGTYIPSADTNPLADGDQFREGLDARREKYIEGCREQTIFLNKKILAAVKQVKKNSKRPTIIILQGDHGPGAHFSHKSLAKSNIEERFSNLTAVYYSGPKVKLPEDISAVNIFRYVLNDYFGTNFPILPNKQYYSTEDTPCNFTDVTKAYKKLQQ